MALRTLSFVLATIGLSTALTGQTPSTRVQDAPRANGGHIPPSPSARPLRAHPKAQVEPGFSNSTPHVSHDQWYGHESPNDPRFKLPKPFEHGRFQLAGPTHRFRIQAIDWEKHRIWFWGGPLFQVPDWEWEFSTEWCWNCGDDFVLYEDPDHSGWYLLYNLYTGTFVHVLYLGG